MISRAGRAVLLDRKPFTEAFFDGDAAADAAILVSGTAAITYLGQLVVAGVTAAFSITALLQVVIAGVVSWLILGLASWFAATRLFSASGRPQTMIGLQGLAVAPLLLEVLRPLAVIGTLAAGIGLIWYLVILVVATREAADITMRNAAVSVLIGFAIATVFRLLLGVPFALFHSLF
jgi:hypothetical protein